MTESHAAPPTYRRLYVWELPVRAYHWINAAAIVVLGSTGYIIGNPPSLAYMPEASQQSWFGTVRMVHFIAGYVFLFNFLVRVYWGFVGNRYARWDQFIPTTRRQWRELVEVLKVDVLQTRLRGAISIGHNMLAGFTYFLSFWVFLFQALTGFALYSDMSGSFLPRMARWVVPLMGGDMAVRHWHHAMLWFYVVFTLIHVYLVFYHDYVEGRGTTSSMVGGWKFERDDGLQP
jgi:Ni/Fe-hydrogenase 1 B-type cytochrome subunit